MTWITRFSRACPYCMFAFERLIFIPGYKYDFKIKFNYDSEYYELSNISTKEPLFYNNLGHVYIEGIKMDERLAFMQLMFMRNFNKELSLRKYKAYPFVEFAGIYEHLVSKLIRNTEEIIYMKAHETALKPPHEYEKEVEILGRIKQILSTK